MHSCSPSVTAYSVASRHTLLGILVHVNLPPRRHERIRYGAISNLSPWRCCLLSSNDGAMKTQEAARRAMGLTIDASVSDYELGDVLASAPPWSSTMPPTPHPPSSDRPSSLSPPLMYLKAVSSRAASAAVDKYWKCYPSLKHHSFTYRKCASLWAPSPHCWQGGRQHQARAGYERASSDATTDIVFTAKIAGEQTACLNWAFAGKTWAGVSNQSGISSSMCGRSMIICPFLLISPETAPSLSVSVGIYTS